MFKIISNKKGYSLIELVIVIGLVGIVSVPLFMTFTTGLTIFESETSSNDDIDELRRFQLGFNEFIRSKTIGDVKLETGDLEIDGKLYSHSNSRVISTEKITSDEIVLLDNVESYKIENISIINDNVTYFELSISIKDHDKIFSSKTSYKIRGDY